MYCPTFLEDVKAYVSVGVDVRMEHLRVKECDFWRLVWVLFCEDNAQMEHSAFPVCVIWTEDHGLPLKDVGVAGLKEEVYSFK